MTAHTVIHTIPRGERHAKGKACFRRSIRISLRRSLAFRLRTPSWFWSSLASKLAKNEDRPDLELEYLPLCRSFLRTNPSRKLLHPRWMDSLYSLFPNLQTKGENIMDP